MSASTINLDTRLDEAGEAARHLAQLCSWDIEPIAHELFRIADEQRVATTVDECRSDAVLRMLGARILTLNSIIMSYLDKDNRPIGACMRDYGAATVSLEELTR